MTGNTEGSEGTAAGSRDDDDVDEVMRRIEEDPPDKLEDWPDGKAKYRTLGGGEIDTGWDEGPTRKLGPADLRYHEDGSVSVGGEKVDNPDDYKSEPIENPLPSADSAGRRPGDDDG